MSSTWGGTRPGRAAADFEPGRELAGGMVTAVPSSRVAVTAGALAALAAVSSFFGACSDPCCTTDGFPINLVPGTSAEGVGLVARSRDPAGDVGSELRMSIDTGSSLTLFRRQGESNQIVLKNFDILDARSATDPLPNAMGVVVRGQFRGVEVLPLPLRAGGPDAVFGGALMQNFSVQFDFAKPAMTFWSRQGAGDGFLSAAGFAVFQFNLQGGAELTARSRPDFLGFTGPVEVPATRVVLRACGGVTTFDPDAIEPEACCLRSDAASKATGANLALVLSTGVGPLVLTQSAWDRIVAAHASALLAPLPAPAPGAPLFIPSLPTPLTDVSWSTLPRLALVDQELDDATNPGACVELARARRLAWAERHVGTCIQPCDSDPRDATKAQNAAAYVELGGDMQVAVVPDSTAFLQGLRAEIRPEGPEVDGLIGADALASTRMEVDYRGKPGRVIVSCELGTTCFASPRCARLSNPGDFRACFGRKPRSLPSMCEPVGCP